MFSQLLVGERARGLPGPVQLKRRALSFDSAQRADEFVQREEHPLNLGKRAGAFSGLAAKRYHKGDRVSLIADDIDLFFSRGFDSAPLRCASAPVKLECTCHSTLELNREKTHLICLCGARVEPVFVSLSRDKMCEAGDDKTTRADNPKEQKDRFAAAISASELRRREEFEAGSGVIARKTRERLQLGYAQQRIVRARVAAARRDSLEDRDLARLCAVVKRMEALFQQYGPVDVALQKVVRKEALAVATSAAAHAAVCRGPCGLAVMNAGAPALAEAIFHGVVHEAAAEDESYTPNAKRICDMLGERRASAMAKTLRRAIAILLAELDPAPCKRSLADGLVAVSLEESMETRRMQRRPSSDPFEDSPPIDFTAAGLYLGGLQVCAATLATSLAVCLCGAVLPVGPGSALRTAVLAGSAGAACVWRPLRLGRVRGVSLVFNALRPGAGVYLCFLCVEQLAHSCRSGEGGARRGIVHLLSLGAAAAGLMRARAPTAESDAPFLLTLLTGFLAAVVGAPPVEEHGPLCDPFQLFACAERVLRACLFAFMYSVFVYSSPPVRNTAGDCLVSVARAAAASAWVLWVHLVLLILVFVQAGLVFYNFSFPVNGEEYAALDTASENEVEEEPRAVSARLTKERLAEIAQAIV